MSCFFEGRSDDAFLLQLINHFLKHFLLVCSQLKTARLKRTSAHFSGCVIRFRKLAPQRLLEVLSDVFWYFGSDSLISGANWIVLSVDMPGCSILLRMIRL